MSLESRPAAVPFDPGSGELPPALEHAFAASTRPILLLVAADADDAAARVAIALAQARAGRGGATVLADADLDAPRLHRHLDVANLEGLVDVFLFGASLARVTIRPDARRFDFAPAGAYAPDPAEVLQSPRWDRIAEEVSGDDALLLVFVPAGAPGLRELSRRIGQAVLLADDPAAARVADRLDPACEVLGVVAPPPPAAPRPGGPDEASGSPAASAGSPVPDPLPGGRRRPGLDEPLVIRDRKKQRGISPILLIALALALAAAVWFGYQELFGNEAPPPAVPAPAATAPDTPAEPGEPLETEIPFSVALAAHSDLETATEQVSLLSRSEPDVTFFLAPVSVRGEVYYRVLAGPLAELEQANALMQRFVDRDIISGMAEWAVRPRPLAFHLGDYDAVRQAESRVESLVRQGIPAYTVPQRYESGMLRYRVYGGAYENQAEAVVMRQLLENAGEPARLIPRVGEPAA